MSTELGSKANLYSYVGNDPINMIDPDGLKATFSDDFSRNLYNALKNDMYSNPSLKSIFDKIDSVNNVNISSIPDEQYNDQSGGMCVGNKSQQQIRLKRSLSMNPNDVRNKTLLLHELYHSWELAIGRTGNLDSNGRAYFLGDSYWLRFRNK